MSGLDEQLYEQHRNNLSFTNFQQSGDDINLNLAGRGYAENDFQQQRNTSTINQYSGGNLIGPDLTGTSEYSTNETSSFETTTV